MGFSLLFKEGLKGEFLNNQNIIIRSFFIEDYDAVTALWIEAGIHYRPRGRESRPSMAKELKSGQAIFLVAVADETIAGVVLGTHDARKGWINRLAVAKEFRRQKVASKLVAAVENSLHELGIEVIACLIEPENSISKTFFSKIGYTKAPVEYYSKKRSADA
jgi:ribosomal protein S18 acetylase RimI-like enzyme